MAASNSKVGLGAARPSSFACRCSVLLRVKIKKAEPMKKILVIEDEPEMRRKLLTILKMEKFHAFGAENGRAGVETAKREHPDLILCDVMMPEMDGYGVLERLRADPATNSVPFIFLTA